MSTDADDGESLGNGVPELTLLGKRIEFLRLERRMSKRVLAQRAGTSRQQLWRVMTGKSELTSSLCARLSEVLETDSRLLREAARYPDEADRSQGPRERLGARALPFAGLASDGRGDGGGDRHTTSAERFCQTLEEYVSSAVGLERTFQTLPSSDDGRRLKRVLLDAIEDIAIARALKLPQTIFDLRRAVVNDDA